MNGFKFLLEYPNAKERRKATRKNLGNHSGNVIAAFTGRDYRWLDGNKLLTECISALQDHPNSVVCSSSFCDEYQRERCLRISEAQAREIHPNLFYFLDQPE